MQSNKLNFNYVFFAPENTDLVIRYHDLDNTEYSRAVYYSPNQQKPKNKFMAFIYKIHMSNKINKTINLPFKHIWEKKLILPKIEAMAFIHPNPCCFVIYSLFFEYLGGEYRDIFLQYLRTEYKDCRIVLYYSDLMKKYPFDHGKYRNYFDVIFSFDRENSFNNNFIYYGEQFFSLLNVKNDKSIPQSDVVFIGKAKNRFNTIISIFELLEKNNFSCDFHIVGVRQSEQKHSDKIKYYPRDIHYYKVLQHVISSKCILEILQDGGSSHTARVSEAISYGKRILSNCQDLRTKPYYNPEYISLFSGLEDIDIDFLKKNTGQIDYKYQQNLSPLRLIERIDEYFINRQ
jgi:hypothetical protein